MRIVSVSSFRNCNKAIAGRSTSILGSQFQQASPINYLTSSYCYNEHINTIKTTCLSNNLTNRSLSFSSQRQNQNVVRYFPNYVVYKEDATFSLKFIPPVFKTNNQNINIGRKGKLVFEVAPRIEGDAMTDWTRAINIALSVEELGELLCNIEQLKESRFNHNSLQGDNKTITILPGDNDGSCEINMHAEDQAGESKEVCVVLAEGEMEVIKNIINTTLPNLVAFNTLVEQSITTLVNRENNQISSNDSFYRNDFDM